MQITIKVENAVMVKRNLEDLGLEIPQIGRQHFFGAAQRIQRRMSKPAPRIGYPVRWDSVRQRKAFFASDGFGGGIPHVRSGRYQSGYQIQKSDSGYIVYNRMPGAQFIGGDAYGQRQSRIHEGRWPLFRDVVEQEIEKLPEDIFKAVQLVIRRRGFSE